jgi:hypothetical protein
MKTLMARRLAIRGDSAVSTMPEGDTVGMQRAGFRITYQVPASPMWGVATRSACPLRVVACTP